MRYQLINPKNNNLTNVEQVLFNRDININDLNRFRYPDENELIDPLKLKNMHEGVQMLVKHIEQNDKVFI